MKKKKTKGWDILISGSGFYEIAPASAKGGMWVNKHLAHGERSKRGDSVLCDGGQMCRTIVAAMDRDGLRVKMNGVDMSGFGGK